MKGSSFERGNQPINTMNRRVAKHNNEWSKANSVLTDYDKTIADFKAEFDMSRSIVVRNLVVKLVKIFGVTKKQARKDLLS